MLQQALRESALLGSVLLDLVPENMNNARMNMKRGPVPMGAAVMHLAPRPAELLQQAPICQDQLPIPQARIDMIG